MEQFKQIYPYVFPFLFIGMWVLVLKILSIKSGWVKLVEKYCFLEKFKGKYYRSQSAKIKKVNFSGSLEMGVNERGLYLIPMILFRLFHKPILIPWVEIHGEAFSRFLFKGYRLKLKSYPDIMIEVSRKTFKRMEKYII